MRSSKLGIVLHLPEFSLMALQPSKAAISIHLSVYLTCFSLSNGSGCTKSLCIAEAYMSSPSMKASFFISPK